MTATRTRAPTFVELPSTRYPGDTYLVRGGDYGVVLSGMWTAVPVFHGLNHRHGETICGRDAWTRDGENQPDRTRGEWLPIRHLLRFARPCKECWP